MLWGLAIAVSGLVFCPVWHGLFGQSIVFGYLAGLGALGAGCVVGIVGYVRRTRANKREGKKNSLGRELGLQLLLILSVFFAAEAATTAWVQFSGQRGDFREFRLADRHEKTPRFVPHPFLGFMNNPDFEGVNSLGFFGPEWARENAEGTVRIACLGGSTTVDMYPQRLEQYLNDKDPSRRYETMNFGTSGWNSVHSLINYTLNVRHYRPDIVVIHHAANEFKVTWYGDPRTDYANAYRSLETPTLPRDRFFVRYFNSYALLKWRYIAKSGGEGGQVLEDLVLRNENWQNRFEEVAPAVAEVFESNIEAILKLARADGAIPVIMTQPYNREDDAWTEGFFRHMERFMPRLRAIAERTDTPLVDMERELSGRTDLFADPLHLQVPGIELKAASLADALIEILSGSAAADAN